MTTTARPSGAPGPARGGPEDHPERLLTLSPAHPGAYRWLDARTLQFRPAEPWPPLARFSFKVEGKSFSLATLLSPPTSTNPADGAEGLSEVSSIVLEFGEPLDAAGLAKVVTLEVRPLPGVDGAASRWLDGDDFAVKVLERTRRDAPASYELALKQPIGPGQRVVVHFQLSLESSAPEALSTVAFSTLEPFRVSSFGCPGHYLPGTLEGTRYAPEQAVRCEGETATVFVEFSAPMTELSPVAARNLLRFSPPVANLDYHFDGRRLWVYGDFARDTQYRMDLVPTPLQDTSGRPLELAGANQLYLFFPAQPSYLRWGTGAGLVERMGPQEVPLTGRGADQVDLRIQRIDPLSRSFWPFPKAPVVADESQRPPGPGEEPEPFTDPAGRISAGDLLEQIRTLGSPQRSRLISLPLARRGTAASFGLDLADELAAVAGSARPGTYLLGLRTLDSSKERAWMRLAVTDLALSTVEEPHRVVFAVTSLASGAPLAGAKVRVEGAVSRSGGKTERGVKWETLFEGTTDGEGRLVWNAPGDQPGRSTRVQRIVASQGDDVLVLDPADPPDYYADGAWLQSHHTWLQWTQEELQGRGPQLRRLAHLFTERPVYRPEEPVHIKGYLRYQQDRTLTPLTDPGFLVVTGPGNLTFRYPVKPDARGGFYYRFHEEKLPTGTYSASFVLAKGGERLGGVSFRVEAYRLPQFEVQLHGPDRVGLDREFEVKLTANYYAGGRVVDRPIAWRVTQFPYDWSPAGQPGYFFSSDRRFSPAGRFESTPTLSRADTTDADGAGSILINPTIEPTSQPRSYVVEATVTGVDEQTVTSTRRVVAVPPFLVGLKVPRYVEKAGELAPQLLLLGPDEKPLAGVPVKVKLIHRQWHSLLKASDFSDGVARYITELVDEPVAETQVTSGSGPLTVKLATPEAGVYLVEAEAQDRLGRSQAVSVDLFVGGEEAVTWARPGTGVFKASADKERYQPGETANIVLESPFQSARALAVVEAPEGMRYQWLTVEGGKASLALPIAGLFAPRLPVHFLLMRGRLPGTRPAAGNKTDLGKPATLAATLWLEVEPTDNRVEVKLDYPPRALPGQEINVDLSLADPQGRPLAGEVTLWLVDQAVLALGEEQRLDPLPDFLAEVISHLVMRDTRGMVFGQLPFAPVPGGDEGKEKKGLFDRQTVRKNFQPVPYYNPGIEVGPSGKARVKVKLPDNLTNFKLRAKAVAGAERFGFAVGHLEVRLPVIVQPALPRFVRLGDRFTASAVGRIVEGPGGAGSVAVKVAGVQLVAPADRSFEWDPAHPERFDFDVSVPSPAGASAPSEATFQVAVERSSDRAGDAFEVKIPILPDREPVELVTLAELAPGKQLNLPEPAEPARPGTLSRSALLSNQKSLLSMAAGLDFLLGYPYGCTEQRLSRSRAQLALGRLRELLHLPGGKEELDRGVKDTLDWLPQVVSSQGLVAYWPGSEPYVSLTAWSLQFLVEAKAAGYPVEEKLEATLVRALEQALRSDYPGFVPGSAWSERVWALRALAEAGHFEAAYADELARQSQFLSLEGQAGVAVAFERGGKVGSPAVPALRDGLVAGIGTQLYGGKEVFAGLNERQSPANPLILPSESRTLAEMARALARVDSANPRLPLLLDGLVRLGKGDGWGDTNANASALLALAETVKPPFAGGGEASVDLALGSGHQSFLLGANSPTAFYQGAEAGKAQLSLGGGATGGVGVLARTRYLPAADGSRAEPRREGFVVRRELADTTTEPPTRTALTEGGKTLSLPVGTVVEEHVEVVNPEDRHYVAVVVPLAAGMEPLNPALATAPPEAKSRGKLTLAPSYVAFLDDSVAFYYNTLPKGTYDFYFRTRATVAGSFQQPPAKAQMMYQTAVVGTSAGARVEVVTKKGNP